MCDMANGNSNAFADFMWMEDMDKFEQDYEANLEEQEFIKSCIEQILDEEDENSTVYYQQDGQMIGVSPASAQSESDLITAQMNNMNLSQNGNPSPNKPQQQNGHQNSNGYNHHPHVQSRQSSDRTPPFNKVSTLNPNAAVFNFNPRAREFVPNFTQNGQSNSTVAQPPISYHQPHPQHQQQHQQHQAQHQSQQQHAQALPPHHQQHRQQQHQPYNNNPHLHK